tara:strand:+ start:275 stop:709 length:435 start_codon:yes stop_codon:yes gene_type:complete
MEFPGEGKTKPVPLPEPHDGIVLEVRPVKPRTYRSWGRLYARYHAEEVQRVEREKRELDGAPDHPCHQEGYVTQEGDDRLAEIASVVLEGCLDTVTGLNGAADGKDAAELAELLDWKDLKTIAGVTAFQAQAPDDDAKKNSGSP